MVALWQKTNLWIILTLFCAQSMEAALPTEDFSQVQFYKDFLMKIYDEEKFDNCMIYGEFGEKSETLALLLQIIVEDFKQPIIFQNMNSFYQISRLFNIKIIVIAHLENFDRELPVLADILNRMRQKRIVLISTEPASELKTEQYLTQLFRLCETQKMLNVVVIFVDFPQTKRFYSYTIFPTFQLEKKSLRSSGVEMFPPRVKNLHGYGIRTIPDQIFPFTFAYELNGLIKVSGYFAKLLETFSKSINGTVAYPEQVVLDKVYFPTELLNMTRNNELDIPMARMYLQMSEGFDQASNPFSITGVCLMTPVRWFRSFHEFNVLYLSRKYYALTSIGIVSIFILIYLCRRLQYLQAGRRCYESLLYVITAPKYWSFSVDSNHPAYLKRLLSLCILVFVSMVWVICIYTHLTANLNTFLTKPSMEPTPRDWDDLHKTRHSVLISLRSYTYFSQWCGEFWENLENYFVIVETEKQFNEELLKLNTNYAYLIDLFSWHFIHLRMRPLKKPIFSLTDLCVRREIVYCLPLQPNSIFKESLNLFLTRTLDHGLKQFWVDATYLEAVSAGKIYNITYTDAVPQPLNMAYISFAWPLFGFAWSLAILIFACEVLFGPRQKIRQ